MGDDTDAEMAALDEAFEAEIRMAVRLRGILRREMDYFEVKSIEGPPEGDDNTFRIELDDGAVFVVEITRLRGAR